ncbi:hypothetical protein CN233_04490 [Sinorhizobium meliloti]|uniref:hypothetical protein n=1 Tax=Rhizobium meliloti TaxID=382 RepID=UPI000FDA4F80|nr:hypothetical protein [Sinorhizobium meliloti]RVG37996.1 hypothetical protein CN233_04490 [Sinorhizobium meliloti]
MTDKFKIVDMKDAHGHWTVKFDNVQSSCAFGAPIARVDREVLLPEGGIRERTIDEVVKEAHKEVANDLYRLFKRSVISIPGVDWETVKSLAVSEILNELGLDEDANYRRSSL